MILQVLQAMEEEVDNERWKMPEEEEDQEEFWGFEDLDEDNDSSFTFSLHDSTSSS